MKNLKFLLKYCIFTIIINFQMQMFKLNAQVPPNDPAYQLVFLDTFPGTQLDASKWDKSFEWHQNSNKIHMWCRPENHFSDAAAIKKGSDTTNYKVNGGSLKMYARKENYVGQVWNWPLCNNDSCHSGIGYSTECLPNNYSDTLRCWDVDYEQFKLTTSLLRSAKKFKYGYFELKFRMPQLPTSPKTYKGLGAAFWLWNSTSVINWSEIDVFEINAFDTVNSQYNYYTSNVHYRKCYPKDTACFVSGTDTIWSDTLHLDNFTTNGYISSNVWHTASINWTPDKIEFFLDNIKYKESTLHSDELEAMPIFINPTFPLDNFCVEADTIHTYGTQFPYMFEVGYMKVWQLKQSCNTDTVICNFNPATYNSRIYKSVTIGGTGCNASITNQSNFSAYGNNYILLDEGFSVDNLSNAYFNVQNNCQGQYFGSSRSTNNPPLPPPQSFFDRNKYH